MASVLLYRSVRQAAGPAGLSRAKEVLKNEYPPRCLGCRYSSGLSPMSNQHLGRKTAFRRRRILSGVAAQSDASSEAILTPRDFCPIPTCRGKRCFLNKNMVGFATQAGPPSDGFPAGIIRICAVPRRRAGIPSSGLRRRLRQDRTQTQYDILYLLYIMIIVYPRFIISPRKAAAPPPCCCKASF